MRSRQILIVVLNPRYKLLYFKDAGWTQQWVDAAKEITANVYNTTYAGRSIGKDCVPSVPFGRAEPLSSSSKVCFTIILPVYTSDSYRLR